MNFWSSSDQSDRSRTISLLRCCCAHSLNNVSKIRSVNNYIFPGRYINLLKRCHDNMLFTSNLFCCAGRLHQVEYAIEAINNAGTCVGLLSTDGIVLTAERRVVSKLLAPSKTSEKTYTIDNHVVALVAGLTADANILINQSRLGSQRYVCVVLWKVSKQKLISVFFFSRSTRYLYTYQEPMPVEQVVKSVCNYKQAYTQYGGLRPFGTAFLFAGWDSNFGFQLYQTDPSGNYSGWKATVIGPFMLLNNFAFSSF